jgi:hypothetical protein
LEINKRLKESGRFWQVESFDHLVLSPEQFEYFREYIAQNGPSARLKPGEYHLLSAAKVVPSRREGLREDKLSIRPMTKRRMSS